MTKYKYGRNSQIPQILATVIMSLTGLSYGMLFSWTSPSIPTLVADKSLNITLEEASYFTVFPQISMIISAPLYSILMNSLGRKLTTLLIGIPQLLAWILTAIADDIILFYVARLLVGLGDAGVYTVIPLYICEILEPGIRGTWGNTITIMIAFAKFFVILIGAYTSIKMTAIIGACMTLIFFVLAIFLPESPYYLLIQNKESDARKSLSILRWRCDVEDELTQLKSDVKRQISESSTYKEIFKVKSNRKAFIIALGLRIAQQYSGLVAFESYTQYMFQEAGGEISAKMSAILFSFTGIPAVLVFSIVSDKFGRRKLAIFSSTCCTIILCIVAVYFGIQKYTDLPLENFSWIPLAGMISYFVACCTGLACLPILMLGELFSASVKAKAAGIITIVLGVNAIIIPKLFQLLTHNFGIFTPFVFFACCTFLSIIFCYFYVIETHGRTLEEIQQDLKDDNLKSKQHLDIKC